MSAPSYLLESVAFAEHLLEIADTHGTAPALVALGENWTRLDSTAPVLPLLHRWAKGYTVAALRDLLMSEEDRRAEKLLRLPRKRLRVYRVGYDVEHAGNGLVWHRRKRDAVAYARAVGAEFIATAELRPNAYAAAKYLGAGWVAFLVLPDAAPAVLRVDVIGGRRNG